MSAGYGSHKGGKGGVIRGSVLGRVGGHIVLCHLPCGIRTGKSETCLTENKNGKSCIGYGTYRVGLMLGRRYILTAFKMRNISRVILYI